MISKNLELIRRIWGLKQNEMSELLNVTQPMYQTYEGGTRNPDVDFFIQLSDFTGITVKRLRREVVGNKEIPEKPIKDFEASEVHEEMAKYGNDIWKAIIAIDKRTSGSH